MWDHSKSTGSIAQDALLSGFMVTCNKGIAKLLQVDDVTLEECKAFEQRHLDRLADKEVISNLEKDITTDIQNNFNSDVYSHDTERYFTKKRYKGLRSFIYDIRKACQQKREYKAKVTEMQSTHIDVSAGKWVTEVIVEVYTPAWSGLKEGIRQSFPETTEQVITTIETSARICTVNYIDYGSYSDRLIPDEALEAARDAISIGLTHIRVAIPQVENTQVKDPIIIGHNGNTMFLIAWFGYNKDHMSCNT